MDQAERHLRKTEKNRDEPQERLNLAINRSATTQGPVSRAVLLLCNFSKFCERKEKCSYRHVDESGDLCDHPRSVGLKCRFESCEMCGGADHG